MKFFFDVHVEMAFVLTSTSQSNIWMLSNWLEIMGQFTYSKRKVASLLWFAHYGMRSCGDAQLWSCSHLVDYKSLMLNFQVNLIGQRTFWGDKPWHFLVHRFFHPKGCAHFAPSVIAHLPCFKILWTNLILTSKLVHETSKTYVEWNALMTTLSWAWKIKG